MTEAQTHEVVVRKDIKLATGESIGAFTTKARDEGTKWVRQKLNLQKESSVYPIEIFSKSMVFDVAQFGQNVDPGKRYRYFAVAYSRKDNGGFEFDSLTEVERVTTFRAKQSTPVMKAMDNADAHPGWDVKKALFEGVI